MSDIFQEVEEDVRRERYEQLWKKYGNYVIALAVLVILGVAGYQAWKTYDLRQREAFSDRYQAAIALVQAGNAPAAESAFADLVKDAPEGYATLAKFQLATALIAQGKRDQAVATLRELVNEPDPLVAQAARLRLAWTIADAAPRPEIMSILQPLLAPDNPWRFAASEVVAYLDFMQGSRSDAETQFAKLANDANAPPSLRQRAAAIAGYLKANPTAVPITPPAPAPAAAPAGAETPAAPTAAAAKPAAPAQRTRTP